MEGFNEQVVHRATKPKNIIIKIISILLLITVPLICIMLAYVIVPYMIYVGLFLFLGGIYAVWYVFTSQKVDFEYSISGDELQVSKVIALRKRKKVCKVSIREIDTLTKDEDEIAKRKYNKTFIAAGDIDAKDENYFATFNSPAYGKCLLIFTPNEQILQGMKPFMRKEVLLNVFYKKSTY